MEHGSEIITLRDASERIYISTSLEQTFEFIEKLAGPFNFRPEETMVF